jgi:hypothetical protein
MGDGSFTKNGGSHHTRCDLFLTLDITSVDWISDRHENNWQATGRPKQSIQDRGAACQDRIRRESYQRSNASAGLAGICSCPVDVDSHVTAVSPSQLSEPLMKDLDACVVFRVFPFAREDHLDAAHPLWLLRAPNMGPRRRGAAEKDEIPPSHVTPSSAMRRPDYQMIPK